MTNEKLNNFIDFFMGKEMDKLEKEIADFKKNAEKQGGKSENNTMR